MEADAHNRIRFRVMFFAVICFKLSACRGHTRAEMHFPDSVGRRAQWSMMGMVVLFVVHHPLEKKEKELNELVRVDVCRSSCMLGE